MLKKEQLKNIKYINLHSHTNMSLQDGVRSPSQHYVRSAELGWEGCSCTDHGSYAAGLELFLLEKGARSNQKLQDALKTGGRPEGDHPTVKGCELYIYDDRYQNQLQEIVSNPIGRATELKELVEKLSNNGRFSSLFNKKVSVTDIEVVENKRAGTKKGVGTILLEAITKKPETVFDGEDIAVDGVKMILDLATGTTKCRSYKYNHITVIAKNGIGHKNLSTLSTIATLKENSYTKPRISLSKLIELKEGLVVTTGCFIGMIPQAIYRGTGEAEELMKLFKKEFGDDFFVEFHLANIIKDWDRVTKQFVSLGKNLQEDVNIKLVELANKHDVKIYITQDSHYPKKEDHQSQTLLLLADSRNSSGWHFAESYHMMSVEEMYEKWTSVWGHIFNDEQFLEWCANSMIVLEKTKDFQKDIDTSLKMMTVNYDIHPVNNPIVINDQALEDHLNESGVILTEVEKYVFKDQVRCSLKRGQKEVPLEDQTMEKDYLKLNKFFELENIINKEATEENKKIIEKLESDLRSWEKLYETEEDLQRVLNLSEDDRFPDLSLSLRTTLKAAIFYGKVDFSQKIYRDRLVEEMLVYQFNGLTSFLDYSLSFESLSRFLFTQGELNGPGRGSAAGSIVSFALNITEIDPLQTGDATGLPFWRFLLRERVGKLVPHLEESPEECEFSKELAAMSATEHEKSFDELWDYINKNKIEVTKAVLDELRYLRTNPELATYFLKMLLFKKKYKSNPNNTHLGAALGICPKATGEVKSTQRGVPDIDWDSSNRDMLVDYLIASRGRDKVSLLGTYGSLKLKSAFKTVLRTQSDLSAQDQNKVSALFDRVKFSEAEMGKGEKYLFDESLKRVAELSEFFIENPQLKDMTRGILEEKVSAGTHACGILVLDQPIYEMFPCRYDYSKDPNGQLVTMNTKDDIEALGGIKLDLLGLGTLEIIRDAIKFIQKRDPEKAEMFRGHGWIEKMIKLKDLKAMGLLTNGKTLGLFQANTPVQTATYNDLKIDASKLGIEDISAITAIDRPGPMILGVDKEYIRRKNGESSISYAHPALEPFLAESQGLMVYQEQVMMIAQELGGLTKEESDILRKAMGKKKTKLIEGFRAQFIKNIIDNKIMPEETANEIYDGMANFAEYCFNKSHSWAYGCLTYITAYFKAHHTLEFCAALMSRSIRSGKSEEFSAYYREWSDFIESPNVNLSGDDFEIHEDKIYMPIFSIKGVGEEKARKISELRPFNSFKDLVIKLRLAGLEEKVLIQRLITSGACDCFADTPKDLDIEEIIYSREDLLDISPEIIAEIKTKLELGMALDQEEIDLIAEKTATVETQEERISFRKNLLKTYFFSLRKMKLKNKLSDYAKKNNVPSDEIYKIYFTNDLRDTVFDSSDLVMDGKKFDAIKYAKGSPLKAELTPKELEEATKIFSEYADITVGAFILKQLENLGFTSYDFRELFEKELESFSHRVGRKPLMPKDLIDARDAVMGNFNASMEVIRATMCDRKLDFGQKILATRDLILPLIGLSVELINNNKIKSEIGSRLKSCFLTLNRKDSLEWSVALGLCDQQRFIPKISVFVTVNPDKHGTVKKELINILTKTTKIKPKDVSSGGFSANKGGMFDSKDALALFLASLATYHGRASVDKLTDLDLGHLVPETMDLFKKIGPKAEERKTYRDSIGQLEEISHMIQSLMSREDNNDFKEGLSVIDRDVFKMEALSSSISVFGSLFKPEQKKHFVREYGKAIPMKRMCRFFIGNENSLVNVLIFDLNTALYQVDAERVVISDLINDFSPVIITGRLSFDPLRNFEITFFPDNNMNKAFRFLMKGLAAKK